LRDRFLTEVGHNKGVYAINDEIRAWLEEALEEPRSPARQRKGPRD